MEWTTERSMIQRWAGVAALVVVAWALMSVILAGSAVAQTDPYGNGKPDVDAEVIGTGEEQGQGVAGGSNALPFTGADLTLYTVIGACAVGAGVLLVRRTRQRVESA
jgi:LPXTG-motif cell wall-anchored protein